MRLAFGKARFTSEVTQESEMLMFGSLHLGDHNLHGGVAVFPGEEAYRDLAKSVRDAFTRAELADTIRLMDHGFGGRTYSLKNLFKDQQRKVLQEILKPALSAAEAAYRQLYESQVPMLRFMGDGYISIPKIMKTTAEIALNSLLRAALESSGLNLENIQSIFEDVRIIQTPLDTTALEMTLRRNLERSSDLYFQNPRDLERLREFQDQVANAKSLPLPLVLWSIQNRCYEVLKTIYPEMRDQGATEWTAQFEQLAALLELRT
jgi:hypothetical protein